jgi:hypothetical protein
MPTIAQIVVCKMVNSYITFSSNHATATFCAETAARQAALNFVNITENSIGIDGKGYSVALAGHTHFLRKHTAARQWSSKRIALFGALFLPADWPQRSPTYQAVKVASLPPQRRASPSSGRQAVRSSARAVA